MFNTYFQTQNGNTVRRRRGKSPRQIQRFVKTPEHCLQASSLAALLVVGNILRIDRESSVRRCWPRPDIELGHRMCRAYETFVLVHQRPRFNLEWAFNLYHWLSQNEDLKLSACAQCEKLFVADRYALDQAHCPRCTLGHVAHH
jgi:hypothetical protein